MRSIAAAEWPVWIFRSVRHEVVVALLITVLLVNLSYGLTLLSTSLRRRLHDHWWQSYDFWLGCYFIAESLIYGVLAAATFRQPRTDLWVIGLFLLVAVPATISFSIWLRGNAPQR